MEVEVNFLQGSHPWINCYQLENRGHHSDEYESQILKVSSSNFEESGRRADLQTGIVS